MTIEPFNASIIVNGDPRTRVYGVRLDATGRAVRCSEHSAIPDPVRWLAERYPQDSFVLVEDGGAAYRQALRRELFGSDKL